MLVAELTPPVGREARLLTVEYPPGGTSPPHRHPGEIIAYVLEGEVEIRLGDGPTVRYGPGGSWHERPNQLHAVSRNASDTRPAKLLVFFVSDPGVPVTSFGE
jgi:quercetin dioxygenase-like cupin family protein